MCGITGWVDYERDLTGERDIIAAMTAALACRQPGPCDSGPLPPSSASARLFSGGRCGACAR